MFVWRRGRVLHNFPRPLISSWCSSAVLIDKKLLLKLSFVSTLNLLHDLVLCLDVLLKFIQPALVALTVLYNLLIVMR